MAKKDSGISGADEVLEYLEKMADKIEEAEEVIETEGSQEDAEEKIRQKLGLKRTPKHSFLFGMEEAQEILLSAEADGVMPHETSEYSAEDLKEEIANKIVED